MSSKTKTFEAESEAYKVMEWVMSILDMQDEEIVTNTPPDIDVKIKADQKIQDHNTRI